MNNTIDISIDLGTTNSAIAKFEQGEVFVFQNATDFDCNTIPSVVSFINDAIVVGKKAKEFLSKDHKNTFSSFKRKMGTSETFFVSALNKSISPIDLSAFVLKELKTFVPPATNLDAAIITIPASFDIIQSNATKEAGFKAGFKQVELLQEPIAASLAYINDGVNKNITNGKWLVYDLGGGTFDIALVSMLNGEMKVLNHQGDNFLGGLDFDNLIIDKIIIPSILDKFSFSNLNNDLKSGKGKLNYKYYHFLQKAEEAKIMLSSKASVEIVIEGFSDDNGVQVDYELTIYRTAFNSLITPLILETVSLIKKVLSDQKIFNTDLQFVLMVGGSTYIPFLRTYIEEALGLPVNCSIDPTTAIVKGAALYAASRKKTVQNLNTEVNNKLFIKYTCPSVASDKDVLFAAKVEGEFENYTYKILREDKGYNSGTKDLSKIISEDLPLVEDAYNFFTFSVYDNEGNIIETNLKSFSVYNSFTILGQPISEDICLEIDDYNNLGETKLLPIFFKNDTLPLRSNNFSFPLNRSILQNNPDSSIFINVLEGSHLAFPESNNCIGFMEIKNTQVNRTIPKGSDIEILISISESKDITIGAYLAISDQEFVQIFSPLERNVPIPYLKDQIKELTFKLKKEIGTVSIDKETIKLFDVLKNELIVLNNELNNLAVDDVTDKRYQIEAKKRRISVDIDLNTKNLKLQSELNNYYEIKNECEMLVKNGASEHDINFFNMAVSQEIEVFASKNLVKINEKTNELTQIYERMRWNNPSFLKEAFYWLYNKKDIALNKIQTSELFFAGQEALSKENWGDLKEVNLKLIALLPKDNTLPFKTKVGFGQ